MGLCPAVETATGTPSVLELISKYVSRQLGHASIQITANLHGHLFRETGQAAMERLERNTHRRALKLVSGED